MSTSPKRGYRLWALILSLTFHFLLFFGAGIQDGAPRDMTPSVNTATARLKISLIDRSSGTSDAGLSNVDKFKNSKPRNPQSNPSPDSELAADKTPAIFEVSAPVDPYYFKSSELEEKPSIQADISPDLAHQLTGEFPQSGVFRLLINEQGAIDQVIVDESSFSEADLRLVREAFEKVKFRPGKIAGSPVKSELKIEVMLENIVAQPY